MPPMKRIAILVKNERVDAVIAALRDSDHMATIYDVKSAGKEKNIAKSGRGMSSIDVAYVPRKIIATIVEPNQVQNTVATIKKTVDGTKGAIFISDVDDLIPF